MRALRVLVDLSRCQSYGQCVYPAANVFRLQHEEVLEWDYRPADTEWENVRRAATACPVQAISCSRDGGSP